MSDRDSTTKQSPEVQPWLDQPSQSSENANLKPRTITYKAKDALRDGSRISNLRRPFYEELEGMHPFFDIKVREGTRIVAKHQNLTPSEVQRLLGDIGRTIVFDGVAALKRSSGPSVVGETSQISPENSLSPTSIASPDEDNRAPPDLLNAFIQRGAEYYFRSQPDRLAFVDTGKALRTRENSAAVVKALVAIAVQRGWTAVHVAGSEDFRALVWAEATRQGIQVTGYLPTQDQLATSKAFPRSAPSNGRPRARTPGTTYPETNSRPEDSGVQRPHAEGEAASYVLLEFGPARYKFDPDESSSYYVKLSRPDNTEQVLWGVQLREALDAAGAHKGDVISVAKLAVEPTQIFTRKRDETGHLAPGQWSPAKRNKWEIKVLQQGPESQQLAQVSAMAAEAFRQNAPAELTLAKFPQLAGAYVASKAISDALALAGNPPGSNKVAMAAKELLATQISLGNSVPQPNTSGDSGKQDKRRVRQQPRP